MRLNLRRSVASWRDEGKEIECERSFQGRQVARPSLKWCLARERYSIVLPLVEEDDGGGGIVP